MPALEYWEKVLSPEAYELLCNKLDGKRKKKAGHHASGASSHKKRGSFSTVSTAILAGKEVPRFDGCVSCRIVTVRKTMPRDARAIWEKAVIDSIVSCGILPDDNTKIISEKDFTVECVAGMPEMTRIEIIEL